jgi:hypothetical protein
VTAAIDPLPHTTVSSDSKPPRRDRHTGENAPRWSLPALIAITILAAVLYSWNLSSFNLNSFYSAAVLSGTQSWKACGVPEVRLSR